MIRLVFLIVMGLCSLSCLSQAQDQVCFKDQCVDITLAQTPEEQRRGLQGRPSLEAGTGMLFIFSESRRHSFWMKDTLIALDIIWINKAQKIVHIAPHTPPCRKNPCPVYIPPAKATYVLELNAGEAAQLGIQTEDYVQFKFFSAAPLPI